MALYVALEDVVSLGWVIRLDPIGSESGARWILTEEGQEAVRAAKTRVETVDRRSTRAGGSGP